MSIEAPTDDLGGKLLSRGDADYEQAREAAIWNGHKTSRRPDQILLAESADDVVEGVRLARRAGHRIGIRSGGHTFSAPGVREGGLLIDVSRLDDIEVDAATRTAWIGPGTRPEGLEKHLTPLGLFFPYGGCGTVGFGGYMLSGGYGFNGKTYGAAGTNIRALELVTAEGELITADETQNSDYLWAARGGGYGFFGAITRFQIDLFPAPALITETTLTFSLDHFVELTSWFTGVMNDLDTSLTTFIFGHKDHEGLTPDHASVVTILAITFTDSREEAERILQPILQAPVLDHALSKEIATTVTLPEVWADIDLIYPEGAKYISDTFWVKDPTAEGFVEALKAPFETLPTPGSHILLNPWIPTESDGAALSGTTTLPFHVYAVYEDDADEDRVREWVRAQIEALLPYSSGVGKINESDPARDQTHISADNVRRLEALRLEHDPQQLFHDLLSKDH